ncbi:MAG: permease [Candidatus Hodarchaeaceae archaeon]|nr:permease [Candidatus Hodarchaeaceae archaeon]
MVPMKLETALELFGKNPFVHALIIATVFVYLILLIAKPTVAKKSAKDSIRTLKSLMIPIIAALFIAGAIKFLVPSKMLAGFLGEQAGIAAVFIGVAIGSLLPACPFISFPIIAGVYAAGASLVGVMAMLFGSGLAFACRVTCDLMFFNPKVAGARMTLSFFVAVVAGLLVYFII